MMGKLANSSTNNFIELKKQKILDLQAKDPGRCSVALLLTEHNKPYIINPNQLLRVSTYCIVATLSQRTRSSSTTSTRVL